MLQLKIQYYLGACPLWNGLLGIPRIVNRILNFELKSKSKDQGNIPVIYVDKTI